MENNRTDKRDDKSNQNRTDRRDDSKQRIDQQKRDDRSGSGVSQPQERRQDRR